MTHTGAADIREIGLHRRRLTEAEFFERALTGAGLTDVEIAATHRVHAAAASAIVRARKPA